MCLVLHQRLVVLCIIMLYGPSLILQGQVSYQGYLEGIYPARLIIDEKSPNAKLTVSTSSSSIQFIGGCNLEKCKYRGIDTSMTLVFNRTASQLEGQAQYGDGTKKAFKASRVDRESAFSSSCENMFWFSAWEGDEAKHQLILASLPGNQVKGTFYMPELETRFNVSGKMTNDVVQLTLEESGERNIGFLTLTRDTNSAEAILSLAGSQSTFELHVVQKMNLGCVQAQGKFDMVHPNFSGTPYAAVAEKLWKEMLSQNSDYGHVWFEPTFLSEKVISGWMHHESPAGNRSVPINLLRKKNSILKQGKLFGNKRTRTQLLALHKQRIVERHPLRAEGDFQNWAQQTELSAFTVTLEGLALASERHAIYGQLETVVPWRELPKAEALSLWLTARN